MTSEDKTRHSRTSFIPSVVAAVILTTGAIGTAPVVAADNLRLNQGVITNVNTIKKQAGCATGLKVNPQLQLAAQWQTDDVLQNRNLDGDIGSDGSTLQDRARRAGYRGSVAETVATVQSFAINGLDIINGWYFRPDYNAIMSNCANTEIGVWSDNSSDRSVAVAVYGQPA
jgi:uncharacterized protein YkwD